MSVSTIIVTKRESSRSIWPLMVLGLLFWLGYNQFLDTGRNIGGGFERVSAEFKEGPIPEFARAEDGLPIVDGSRQQEPLRVPRDESFSFYAVGPFRAENWCGYYLDLASTEWFDITPLGGKNRLFEFNANSRDPILVTLTSEFDMLCQS